MVRIGLLGGTFDPIHRGHLEVAQAARVQLRLARVLFVPVGDPPHKQERIITPAAHRLAMLELALATRPDFEISHVDLNRPGPHYSVDTIQRIREKKQLRAEDCFFLIGADSLIELPTWYQPAEILSLCCLGVAHRPGYRPDLSTLQRDLPQLEERLHWLEMPPQAISATHIRQTLSSGGDVSPWLPPAVQHYIAMHQLYPASTS